MDLQHPVSRDAQLLSQRIVRSCACLSKSLISLRARQAWRDGGVRKWQFGAIGIWLWKPRGLQKEASRLQEERGAVVMTW